MVSDAEKKSSSESVRKFLCSYGGKILPRSGDGKLRYVGGLTRVLAVDRNVTYAELMVKLGEFCGYSVELRCQLPNGDLETLVSVKSDEELAIILEEYDRSSPGAKIRAVLSPPKSLKTVSPASSVDLSPTAVHLRRYRSNSPPADWYRLDRHRRGRNCGWESPNRFPCCEPRFCKNWHS